MPNVLQEANNDIGEAIRLIEGAEENLLLDLRGDIPHTVESLRRVAKWFDNLSEEAAMMGLPRSASLALSAQCLECRRIAEIFEAISGE